MRARLALIFCLLSVCIADAQAPLPQLTPLAEVPQMAQPPPTLIAPSPAAFAFFNCSCRTSAGAPLPSQLTFAPPPATLWTGSVYSTSANDAVFKAQSACSTERHGSLFDCLNCRCDQ